MSKDEETATPPPANPFCMGEWVLLRPEGCTTYDFDGRRSTSTCRVRRSQIVAVDKVFAKDGRIVVEIAVPGNLHPRVMFDPSPEGKRDADLLVEACLRRQSPPPEMYTFMHSVASALYALALNPEAVVEPNDRGLHQIAERMRQARCITVVIDPA
jgi:hypothetical protein